MAHIRQWIYSCPDKPGLVNRVAIFQERDATDCIVQQAVSGKGAVWISEQRLNASEC